MVSSRLVQSILGVGLLLGLTACGMQRVNSNQHIGVAGQYLAQNSVGRALEELQLAVDADASNALAHYYVGILQLENYSAAEAALTAFDAALENGMDTAELHYRRGLALDMLERPSEAETAFGLATERNPKHGMAWYRLGKLVEARGEIRTAIDLYTRSIHATPRSPLGYAALGGVYVRFGRPSEALQVFRNAIANENPNDTSARGVQAQNRAELGMVYLELGEVDEAVAKLTEAASMHASVPMALSFNLGVARWRRFQQTNAAEDQEQARYWLERARLMCDPALTLARCESIEAAMHELERTP